MQCGLTVRVTVKRGLFFSGLLSDNGNWLMVVFNDGRTSTRSGKNASIEYEL